eukprot:12411245-Karenia_brevis.AAC.1
MPVSHPSLEYLAMTAALVDAKSETEPQDDAGGWPLAWDGDCFEDAHVIVYTDGACFDMQNA